MNVRILPALVILLGSVGTAPALALTVLPSDCVEASTFIEDAARSRDNGITSEVFLAHFDDDLELIKSLPPASRWFVQDDDDAELLRSAVVEVFNARRQPDEEGRAFLNRCQATIGAM